MQPNCLPESHQPKCSSCIKGSRTKLKLLMSAMDLSAAWMDLVELELELVPKMSLCARGCQKQGVCNSLETLFGGSLKEYIIYLDFPIFFRTSVNSVSHFSYQPALSKSIYHPFALLPHQPCTSTPQSQLYWIWRTPTRQASSPYSSVYEGGGPGVG